jgi:sugar lactone lactonase YvrE
LWFTDQHAGAVLALATDGRLETITRTRDRPGGLCWLPDGTPIVVYMTERRLMQLGRRGPADYADLSALASFHCNDMVADAQGRLYVGNFGFDLHAGEAVRGAEIVLVDVDRRAEVAATDLIFPNGSVITPDAKTLLVAETFAHRVSALALDARGRVRGRRVWAELGEATPDGICLDAQGALWVASPGTEALFRIGPTGEILAQCVTRGTPYACMLGGADRRTLFVCTAETDRPEEAARRASGRIEWVRVRVPGSGLP